MSESFNFEKEYKKLPDKLLLALGVILIDTNENKTEDIDKYKQNIHNGRKGKQPKEYMFSTIEPLLTEYLEVKKITNKSLSPSNFKTEFNNWFNNEIDLNDNERKKINDFIKRYRNYTKDNKTAINGETYLKLWNDTIKAPSDYKLWLEEVKNGYKPNNEGIYEIEDINYTQNEIVYEPILEQIFETIKQLKQKDFIKNYLNLSQQISDITSNEKTYDFLFKNVPDTINFITGYSCSKDKYKNMIKDNLLKSVKGDMLESMIIHKSLPLKIIKQYNWSLFFNNVVFHGNDKFYDIIKVRRTDDNSLPLDKLINLSCKYIEGKETLTSVINSLIDTKNNPFFIEHRLVIPELLTKLVACYDILYIKNSKAERVKVRNLVNRIFKVNYHEVNRFKTTEELMNIKTEKVLFHGGKVDDIVLIQSKAGPFSLVQDWLNSYNNQKDALTYGTNLDLSTVQTEAVAKDIKSGQIKRFKLTPYFDYKDKVNKVDITPLEKWYGETYVDFGEDLEKRKQK